MYVKDLKSDTIHYPNFDEAFPPVDGITVNFGYAETSIIDHARKALADHSIAKVTFENSVGYQYGPYVDVTSDVRATVQRRASKAERERQAQCDEVVAKGARWLDAFLVGQDWRSEIDGSRLEMASGYSCILGQTAVLAKLDTDYLGFAQHLERIGVVTSVDDPWFEDHGFYSSFNDDDEDADNTGKFSYSELNAAWDRLLFNSAEF